jgi:hypothetical protein
MAMDTTSLAGLFPAADSTLHHFVLLQVSKWSFTNQTFFRHNVELLYHSLLMDSGQSQQIVHIITYFAQSALPSL